MAATVSQLYEAAEVSELLGEELIKRGEQMLALGRRLLSQADDLNAAAGGLTVTVDDRYGVTSVKGGDEEKPSVGRKGAVGLGESVQYAKNLGTFTRSEFQEATGLTTAAASKWLARLINNKPYPIIELVMQGSRGKASLYQYIPVEGDAPTSRTEYARSVEASAGVGADSMATGTPANYTGRPIGSSGKPGRDKKMSQKRRVKRSSGQIIGGR